MPSDQQDADHLHLLVAFVYQFTITRTAGTAPSSSRARSFLVTRLAVRSSSSRRTTAASSRLATGLQSYVRLLRHLQQLATLTAFFPLFAL